MQRQTSVTQAGRASPATWDFGEEKREKKKKKRNGRGEALYTWAAFPCGKSRLILPFWDLILPSTSLTSLHLHSHSPIHHLYAQWEFHFLIVNLLAIQWPSTISFMILGFNTLYYLREPAQQLRSKDLTNSEKEDHAEIGLKMQFSNPPVMTAFPQ